MGRPYISALIDTYNHERFIAQAIESVLAQDFPASEMEIVVVDDGSTDSTGTIVQNYAPRVRYLRKANGGQASAFNFGIPQLSGEIVAMLDGDDWWARDKLRRVVETFEQNQDVGMVGHGLIQTDTGGKQIGLVLPEQTYRLDIRNVESARHFDQLKGFFGTSKVAYRRKILERALPVPEELVIEADEFLWTLAVAQAHAIVLNEPLFYYRFHENNLFMLQNANKGRLRRKSEVLSSLLYHLPLRLNELGISQEVVGVLLASLRVDAERHRLQIDGGTPWEMFRTEQASFRLAYRQTTFSYRLFKGFVLGLTLLMPPRWFCKLKQWYGSSGLRRSRRVIGEPVSAVPVVERRLET